MINISALILTNSAMSTKTNRSHDSLKLSSSTICCDNGTSYGGLWLLGQKRIVSTSRYSNQVSFNVNFFTCSI